MSEVELSTLLQRLDALLNVQQDPNHGRYSRRRAASDDLHRLESFCGVEHLPVDIVQLLRWQNGGEIDPWSHRFGGWYFLSVEEILSITEEWVSCFVTSPPEMPSERTHLVDGVVWPKAIVPFISWNGDVFGIYDLRLADGSSVIGVDFENDVAITWCDSMHEFVEMIERCVETGRELSVDELQDIPV